MAGPSWLAGLFAAVMILTAGHAASRLAAAHVLRVATEADADGLHAVMGAAMAGMFLPPLRLLPSSVWAVVFGAAAAWFAAGAIHVRRTAPRRWQCQFPIPHLVECLAMLYMLLALPARQGPPEMAMPAMTAPGAAASFPALALVLALFMLGYLLWTTDRLATRARARTAAAAIPRTQHRALITVPPVPPSHPAGPGRPIGAPGAAEATLPTPAGQPWLSATFADCSKMVMSVAMGYMLISML